MKKMCMLLFYFLFIQLYSLHGQVQKWIYEDRNANNQWEFIWSGTNGVSDTIEIVGGNFPLSPTNYSGLRSLKLHYNHVQGTGWAYFAVTTSTDGTGREPIDWNDSTGKGKDISTCDTLNFFVKASNASSPNNIWIQLEDMNNLTTDKLLLKDYITLNDTSWHEVQIPMDEFSWISGVNKVNIKDVKFLVEQYDPSGNCVLYIDNFKFTNANLGSNNPKFKVVYEDTGSMDMLWNFSGITTNSSGGLNIETGVSQNIPLSTNEKYKGNSSLKLHFNKYNSQGWGLVWMSSHSNGYGIPPNSWPDYNATKNISSYSCVNFWIKGDTNTLGRIELADTSGNPAGKIELTDWVWVTNGWQKVVIPFNRINWQSFNKAQFKEMKYLVESDHPMGQFICYIDNMAFESKVEQPAVVPRKVIDVTSTSAGSKVKLTWKNVPWEDGYKIYRNTTSAFPGGVPLATVSWSNSSYWDNGPLTVGSTYYYWIVAYNGIGDSVVSDSVSVTVNNEVKWVYEEEGNDNGQWEYVGIWTNTPDHVEVISGNIPVSTTNYADGHSLKLHFTHTRGNYAVAGIATSTNGLGNEPLGWNDANKGKDLTGVNALQFYIKADDGSKSNECRIKLVDENDKETAQVFLNDYIKLRDTQWHFVQIPLYDFRWTSSIDRSKIKRVDFQLQQYDPSGDYTFYIDNMRFASTNISTVPRFKWVYEDSGNIDMRWNFSGIATNSSGGLNIEQVNNTNIPVSTNEKYHGNTSLKIHINKHAPGGWGFLYFSCNSNGSGTPPNSWNDFSAPKNISLYNEFSFWIKGSPNSIGRLEFGDTSGNTAEKIDIRNYVTVNNTWQKVSIPLSSINWKNCSLRKIKELKYIIDSDMAVGEFTNYIDNMEFSGTGSGIFTSADTVTNLSAVYNEDHILLSWTPVTSDYIVGYNIVYNLNAEGTTGTGLQPSDSPVFVNGRNTSSVKITGFKPKDIIYFAIQSVDDNGNKSTLSKYVKVICLKERKLAAYPNYVKSEDTKTEIWFNVTKEENVEIKIYNVAGQLIWDFKQSFPVGLNKVEWFKNNKSNQLVSSGVYLIRVKGGGVDETTKLILIK